MNISVDGAATVKKGPCNKLNPKLLNNQSIEEKNEHHKHLIELISKLNRNLTSTDDNLLKEEYKVKIKSQWMLLSKIIDRILLILFSIITVIVLGSILLQAPHFKQLFSKVN